MKLNKNKIKHLAWQYFNITLGVLILDFGFYFFFEPINLVSGGMMGLAQIFAPIYSKLSWFTPSIFLYVANTICLIVGLVFLGREFFIKTIYATLASPTFLLVFENTCDQRFFMQNIDSTVGRYIVATICGSACVGFGIGIAMKYHGSTGGMDVIQKLFSKIFKVPLSKTMYFTDAVIVIFSGFILRDIDGSSLGYTYNFEIEPVLYGILTVVITSYIIDTIVLNAKSRRTVYVITDHPIEIRDMIYKTFDRGVTFNSVTGAYTGSEKTMVICTMDKIEAYKIRDLIMPIDEKAFTFITSCKEVLGEYESRNYSQAFRKNKEK